MGCPAGWRQTLARMIAVLVLLALVLMVGVYGSLFALSFGEQRRLVSDIRALHQARYPRPVHRPPPVAGRFGELFAPVLEDAVSLAAEDGRRTSKDEPHPCTWDDATARFRDEGACRGLVEQARPLLARATIATRASEGGLPDGLSPLTAPQSHRLPAFAFLCRMARAVPAGDPRRDLTVVARP